MKTQTIVIGSVGILAAVLIHGCGSAPVPAAATTPVVVTSFSPTESTDDPDEAIRIQFDQPVVPVEQVGVAVVDPPIEIDPAVELAALWDDRQTLVVRPLSSLAPSTRYHVRLRGPLADRAGGEAFSFVYRPLALEETFGFEARALPVDPRLGLRFNQPVRAGDVEQHCTLEDVERGEVIDLRAADPELVGAEMVLTPAARLEQGRDYALRCEELAGAGGDVPLERPLELGLYTFPRFALLGFEPTGDDVWSDEVDIALEFATPVDAERLRAALSARPAIEGLERGTLDGTGTRYSVKVDLKSSTDYRVRVAGDLVDVHGQVVEGELDHRFTTGQARPRLVMETGIFAVEAGRAQGYPVWTRNLSRFDVDCARVPERKVAGLLTGSMNYDPWYDAGDNAELDWKALGLKHKRQRIRVPKKLDKWQLEQLQLGKVCGGKGAKGLFLAELASEEVAPDPDHPWRYHPRQRVLANVTDLGVLLKAGSASGVAWVTSLASGEPVPGAAVKVYTPRGTVAFSGTTDADGIVRLPGTDRLLKQGGAGDKDEFEEDEYYYDEYDTWRARRLIVVVEHEDDLAVVDGNWSNGIQIWNFGVPVDYRGGETRVRGFVLSDRGIYRPGETVHFKGLVREVGIGQPPTVPQGARIKVHVEDSRGATVFDRRLRISRFGGFAFDLELPPEASLGDYHVTAEIKGQAMRESFLVEEFRKVSYELDLDAGERHTRLGRRLAFRLGANYLFGAPVADAAVSWSVMRRPHALRFPRFAEYSFNDDAANGYGYWWWDRDDSGYLDFVADGAGTTNQRGALRFDVRDDVRQLTGPQDYIVQVTVEDQTGESVSQRAAVTAHKSDLYVGLHAQEWVQAVGMPFAVNTVALAPDGGQVAAKAILSYVRQRQVCEHKGGYRSYRECKTVQDKIWSRRVTIPATGTGTERIMPKEPGEYVIRLEGRDERGNEVAASSFVWVLGKGEAFWSGDESARMSVVASKAQYEPGETAKLAPRSSIGAGTALVTLERNGVMDAFVTRLASAGEGIEVPITEAHAPNLYASVALVKGRTGDGDRHRPRFQQGVVEIKVSTARQRLDVRVETDQEKYEPGEQVSGKIVVTAGGVPVESEVCLSVADEGVLQLIAYQTPDPMKTFYASWGLGVDSATNLNRISRLNDPRVIDPDEGGDSGGAGDDGVRSKFVSSAFWDAALLTDASGEVPFSFTAPENLTAFRLMAVAADSGSRFGSGESRITVAKPVLARPLLPRFLSSGDRIEAGVEVLNLTDAAGEAVITAAAKGVRLDKRTERRVTIGAGGSARVRFPATVGLAREAQFTFKVQLGGHRDGVAVTLPVGRPLTYDRRTVARERTSGRAQVAIEWPDDLVARESRLEVTVDRTGMAELGPGLKYLIEYPYGCLEQTLSRFIPLVKVEDLAQSLKLEELRGPKLRAFTRAGVAKVIRHQHEDGHFSLWPGGQTYPHLTVYATYGLSEARRAGVKVDDAVIERSVRAIRVWANADDRDLGYGGEAGTLAMAAYVLAELGQADHGLSARLFEHRRGLPAYGQGFLLSALVLEQAPRAQIETLAAQLREQLLVEDDAARVRESAGKLRGYMSSDVRSSAIVLSALLRVDPEDPAVEQLAEGLRRAQRPGGAWRNTQDNLYALVALADYARSRSAGKLAVTLTLDGRKLDTARLDGHAVLAFERTLDRLAPGALTIETDGPARYAVRLILAREEDRSAGVDNGLKVTREYVHPESGAPLHEFAVGDLVRVKLSVTAADEQHYAALVDPLPAGFEAVNTRLATSAQEYRDERDRSRRWSWRPGWTHTELRDDRVLAFADLLAQGTLELEYLARATTPGSFTAAPAHAEAMYEPDVNGRTAARTIEVRP